MGRLPQRLSRFVDHSICTKFPGRDKGDRLNFISFNNFVLYNNKRTEAMLEKPTLHEQRVARESLFGFTAALAERTSDSVNIQLQESQQSFTIPTKALELLSFILSSMAEGKAISLVPADAELTTQQVADMLNVSRPYVVKLLEQGAIPFKKVGSHRRILLDDLLTYEAQHKANRKANLRFLAEQAQDLNLGYE